MKSNSSGLGIHLQRRPRHARSGSILAFALMAVMGVAMLGACLLQFSASMTRGQVQGIDNKRAFYLAEAGLSEGLFGLMVGQSGNIGTSAAPARFGDGLVWVEAIASPDGRVQLTSTGMCASGRASLSIVVDKAEDTVASLGIFSDGDLVVRPGCTIDSYDSQKDPGLIGGLVGGLGGGPEFTQAGRLGSNGDIELMGSPSVSTRIEGDATPGPNGSVISGRQVTISGSTIPRSQAVELPMIEVPNLPSLGELAHQSTQALNVVSGEHRYDSLVLGPGAKVVVHGPQTLVVGALVLGAGAQLSFDTSLGGIEMHVTEHAQLGENSRLKNLSKNPAQLRILISAAETLDRDGDGDLDPPVALGCTGTLYASVYAPNAALTLGNSLEVFGAITAADLLLSEGSKLHFDQALLEDDGSGPQQRQLLSWRVRELPQVPLVSLRKDPLAELRLQGVTPTKLAAAHQAEEFKIRFINLLGKTLTWVGEEAKFDWSQVALVVNTSRLGDLSFLGF